MPQSFLLIDNLADLFQAQTTAPAQQVTTPTPGVPSAFQRVLERLDAAVPLADTTAQPAMTLGAVVPATAGKANTAWVCPIILPELTDVAATAQTPAIFRLQAAPASQAPAPAVTATLITAEDGTLCLQLRPVASAEASGETPTLQLVPATADTVSLIPEAGVPIVLGKTAVQNLLQAIERVLGQNPQEVSATETQTAQPLVTVPPTTVAAQGKVVRAAQGKTPQPAADPQDALEAEAEPTEESDTDATALPVFNLVVGLLLPAQDGKLLLLPLGKTTPPTEPSTEAIPAMQTAPSPATTDQWMPAVTPRAAQPMAQNMPATGVPTPHTPSVAVELPAPAQAGRAAAAAHHQAAQPRPMPPTASGVPTLMPEPPSLVLPDAAMPILLPEGLAPVMPQAAPPLSAQVVEAMISHVTSQPASPTVLSPVPQATAPLEQPVPHAVPPAVAQTVPLPAPQAAAQQVQPMPQAVPAQRQPVTADTVSAMPQPAVQAGQSDTAPVVTTQAQPAPTWSAAEPTRFTSSGRTAAVVSQHAAAPRPAIAGATQVLVGTVPTEAVMPPVQASVAPVIQVLPTTPAVSAVVPQAVAVTSDVPMAAHAAPMPLSTISPISLAQTDAAPISDQPAPLASAPVTEIPVPVAPTLVPSRAAVRDAAVVTTATPAPARPADSPVVVSPRAVFPETGRLAAAQLTPSATAAIVERLAAALSPSAPVQGLLVIRPVQGQPLEIVPVTVGQPIAAPHTGPELPLQDRIMAKLAAAPLTGAELQPQARAMAQPVLTQVTVAQPQLVVDTAPRTAMPLDGATAQPVSESLSVAATEQPVTAIPQPAMPVDRPDTPALPLTERPVLSTVPSGAIVPNMRETASASITPSNIAQSVMPAPAAEEVTATPVSATRPEVKLDTRPTVPVISEQPAPQPPAMTVNTVTMPVRFSSAMEVTIIPVEGSQQPVTDAPADEVTVRLAPVEQPERRDAATQPSIVNDSRAAQATPAVTPSAERGQSTETHEQPRRTRERRIGTTEPARATATGDTVRLDPSAVTTPRAAAPETGMPERVEARQVIAQIVRDVRHQVTETRREVTVRLDPPELGAVHLKVTTNAAGEVVAQIETANPQVRDLLDGRLTELRRALGDAGVQVGQCTVSLHMSAHSNDGQAWTAQGQPGWQTPRHAQAQPGQPGMTPETQLPAEPPATRSHLGAVDYLA